MRILRANDFYSRSNQNARKMADERHKVLVVDDEQDICDILMFNLKTEGYDVDVANSAEEALTKINNGPLPDIILLDVMMGGMSGFEMAQLLKKDASTANLPIIFLTAKDSPNDTITGLNIGADDYISKPFSLQEVMLRVKAVLRRTAHPAEPLRKANQLKYNTMILDLDRKTVSIDGQDVPFTKTEYELLRLLLEEKGKVLSRQELIDRAWPDDVLVSDRTVDVNITRMRKKIGRYSSNIVTRLGFGYVFEA